MLTVIIFLAACFYAVSVVVFQSVVLFIFLKKTPSIADEVDLERFKKIARLGMYLTIISIPAMVVIIGTGLMIVIRHGFMGLLAVVFINIIMFVFARLGKSLELRARDLPAESEELAAAHKSVSEAWVKKVFPNF